MKGWSSLLSAQSVVKVPVKRAADLGFMCFQPEKKISELPRQKANPNLCSFQCSQAETEPRTMKLSRTWLEEAQLWA